MLSTPAQPAAPVGGPGLGMGGGLNDLFSLQGALPGSGYRAPEEVCI